MNTATEPSVPAPRVGAGVLILNPAGHVLLALRRRSPEAGHWSIVGGKVDFLETLEHRAIREGREEVGLDIALVRLFCLTDHCLPTKPALFRPAYLGQVLSGEARSS